MQHPDRSFMRLATILARVGRPDPNPRVGAVVARGHRAIAVGYHERAGHAHAEVRALLRADEAARDAVLYVTLEPCNHFGRTPPCVDAILRAGIRRVVIGAPDPNPHVAGGGAAALARAGVEVVWSEERAEAEALIAGWSARVQWAGPTKDLVFASLGSEPSRAAGWLASR